MKRCVLALVLFFAAGAAAAQARPGRSDEAQIRVLLDNFATAMRARDVGAIMANYAPGPGLVAYDIVPPLQYRGYDAYRRDYQSYIDQFVGPIGVEYRDLHIVAGSRVAFSYGLEHMSGTLKGGQKSDMWVRFTEGYRKIGGRWYAVHDHISVPTDLDSGKARLDLTP